MSDVMNLNEQTLYLRNKELEAEVTELREAAQAVVDRYPTLVTYRTNPLHALAALLEVEK